MHSLQAYHAFFYPLSLSNKILCFLAISIFPLLFRIGTTAQMNGEVGVCLNLIPIC